MQRQIFIEIDNVFDEEQLTCLGEKKISSESHK